MMRSVLLGSCLLSLAGCAGPPAIYLSVAGDDVNDGWSPDSPVQTHARAAAAWKEWGAAEVRVAEGTWFETFRLLEGEHVRGGFSVDFTAREPGELVTVVVGDPPLVDAEGAIHTGLVLEEK